MDVAALQSQPTARSQSPTTEDSPLLGSPSNGAVASIASQDGEQTAVVYVSAEEVLVPEAFRAALAQVTRNRIDSKKARDVLRDRLSVDTVYDADLEPVAESIQFFIAFPRRNSALTNRKKNKQDKKGLDYSPVVDLAGIVTRDGLIKEAVLHEAMSLLGLTVAGVVSGTGAVLFYVVVPQKLVPYCLNNLGWSPKATTTFITALTVGTVGGNTLWYSSFTVQSSSVVFEYILAALKKFFTLDWSRALAWEMLLAVYITGMTGAFGWCLNNAANSEDFATQLQYLFSLLTNYFIMAASAKTFYSLSSIIIPHYIRKQALISRLLNYGGPQGKDLVFAMRMLEAAESTLDGLTTLETRQSVAYYKRAIEQRCEYLPVAKRSIEDAHILASILPRSANPIDPSIWYNTKWFKTVIVLCSWLSIAGYGGLGVVKQTPVMTAVGVVGWVGLNSLELTFSRTVVRDLMRPTLPQYMGGNWHRGALITNALVSSVCLLSGGGTGPAMYLLVQPILDSIDPFWLWVGMAHFLIWAALIFGGITNSFSILNYTQKVLTSAFAIACYALGYKKELEQFLSFTLWKEFAQDHITELKVQTEAEAHQYLQERTLDSGANRSLPALITEQVVDAVPRAANNLKMWAYGKFRRSQTSASSAAGASINGHPTDFESLDPSLTESESSFNTTPKPTTVASKKEILSTSTSISSAVTRLFSWQRDRIFGGSTTEVKERLLDGNEFDLTLIGRPRL